MITGANRGIGNSIAIKALEDGHRLSIGIRNTESIKGTNLDPRNNEEGKILVNYYDAFNENSANRFVGNTINKFGSLDTIIHCSGIFKSTSLIYNEEERAEIEDLWKVNIMGPWILTKAAWKHLIANDQARIQVLVSMSGKRSKSNLAGYTISKFGLMGLCQTIRNEGWSKGLRVTAFCPGWVNTDMAKGIKSVSKEEMTQPEDIALISSTLLKLPNSSIPFEIAINCNLET